SDAGSPALTKTVIGSAICDSGAVGRGRRRVDDRRPTHHLPGQHDRPVRLGGRTRRRCPGWGDSGADAGAGARAAAAAATAPPAPRCTLGCTVALGGGAVRDRCTSLVRPARSDLRALPSTPSAPPPTATTARAITGSRLALDASLASRRRAAATPRRWLDKLHGAEPSAGGTSRLDELAVHGLFAAPQRRAVADARNQSLGARDGDVEAVGHAQESDPATLVRAHERDDDDVLLASLERVDRVYLHRALELAPAQRLSQPLDLFRVHRDDRHAQLARTALVEQTHRLRGHPHLSLVAQRTSRTSALAAAAHALGVDEVQRDRKWLARDVRVRLHLGSVLQLAVVRGLRHIRRDVRMHAVLDLQQATSGLRYAAVPALLEQAPVDQVLEPRIRFDDAVQGVVLNGRQLLVVTDERERGSQTECRRRFI